MSSLSTHVLDTVCGKPAFGVSLRLLGASSLLFDGVTDEDGRCPALRDLSLIAGTYRLEFEIDKYFREKAARRSDPPFLNIVPIIFGISKNSHIHVPILISPYAYFTYYGS